LPLFIAHPSTDVDYLFLPIVALVFFAFSWKNERATLICFSSCRYWFGPQLFINR